MVPALDAASLSAVARELWNRNGYGAIGTAIIRDHPLFGIGVGGFNIMQADFARVHGFPILPPDNAQNWYRQQLAELGVVGSVGWVWWAALFGLFVLRRDEQGIAGPCGARDGRRVRGHLAGWNAGTGGTRGHHVLAGRVLVRLSRGPYRAAAHPPRAASGLPRSRRF